MQYKGYTAKVEFDQEAGVLFGEVEGLRDVVTFEATDVTALEREFKSSIDDYLAMCAERREEPEKPYSGKFLLRIDPALHREIALAAQKSGKSLNAFAAELLRSFSGRSPDVQRSRRASAKESAANAISTETFDAYPVKPEPGAVAEHAPAPAIERMAPHHRHGSSTTPPTQTPQRQAA